MASTFREAFFQEKEAKNDALVAAVLENIEPGVALIYGNAPRANARNTRP